MKEKIWNVIFFVVVLNFKFKHKLPFPSLSIVDFNQFTQVLRENNENIYLPPLQRATAIHTFSTIANSLRDMKILVF